MCIRDSRLGETAASSSSSKKSKVSETKMSATVTHDQDALSKRYAYSELDQAARQRVADEDWMFLRTEQESADIKTAFQAYVADGVFVTEPQLCASAVVTEIRLTMDQFSQKRMWPPWLLQPCNEDLKKMNTTDDAYSDDGNENWEVMLVLIGLASAMETVSAQQRFNAASHAPYGHKTNRSGRGNYNFRGNVLEQLLETLALCRKLEKRSET